MDLDHTGDKVDHTPAILAATKDPIYQTPLESDSEGGIEVYMVGNVEELPDKTVEEIHWETDNKRGTTACRMTRVHRKMNLRMALMREDTTQSSIHYTQQIKIDVGTGHDQSVRYWVGLSTRESRSTTL
jgi:hypothetical protein